MASSGRARRPPRTSKSIGGVSHDRDGLRSRAPGSIDGIDHVAIRNAVVGIDVEHALRTRNALADPGLELGALFTALQYVGLQYTTALNVSVLNSLVPVLIVATSAALFRDRISPTQLAGIVVSSLGVLTIIGRGSLDVLERLAFNWGDLIILFNMLVFAIYAACLRLRPPMHWLSFIFVFAVLSVVMTLPFAVLEFVRGERFQADWETIAAVGYVSIFPSVIAFAAWNRGVELIGANRSGPFLHLVPVYTAIFGSALLGEHLAAFHVAGFALILAGVWLASVRPSTGK